MDSGLLSIFAAENLILSQQEKQIEAKNEQIDEGNNSMPSGSKV